MSYFGEKGSDTNHAAELERRRIRRAQRDWIARVRLVKPVLADLLDAATRAKKGKRK